MGFLPLGQGRYQLRDKDRQVLYGGDGKSHVFDAVPLDGQAFGGPDDPTTAALGLSFGIRDRRHLRPPRLEIVVNFGSTVLASDETGGQTLPVKVNDKLWWAAYGRQPLGRRVWRFHIGGRMLEASRGDDLLPCSYVGASEGRRHRGA